MKTRLLSLVGVLVFVSAAIHLALGATGLAEAISGNGAALPSAPYLSVGSRRSCCSPSSHRPPVTTTAYTAGAGLMVLLLLAYADVHA